MFWQQSEASFFNVLMRLHLITIFWLLPGLSEFKINACVGCDFGFLFALLFSGKIKLPFLLGGACARDVFSYIVNYRLCIQMERAWLFG
jgi:hypothetical protein